MKIFCLCAFFFALAAPSLSRAQEPQLQGSQEVPTEYSQRVLKAIYATFDITIAGKPAGQIKARLFIDKAPKTVNHFIDLAEGTKQFIEFNPKKGKVGTKVRRPYYNDLYFHRVTPGLVVQGGCPLGNGRGNPGYLIPDEIVSDLRHNKKGILSMANAGKPNTNSSQFFFTLQEMPSLDGKNTIIGEIVSGIDLLDEMLKVPRNRLNDKPTKPIMIKSVKIEREYL